MKIRHGFVSNSSSSSFIVAFPHKPDSLEELQKMLFGDDKVYPCPYHNKSWDTEAVAEVVWLDMQKKSPSTIEDMGEVVRAGWVDGHPEFDSFRRKSEDSAGRGDIDWDAYNEASRCFAEKYAKQFSENHPDTVFFSFEYADGDGNMETAMEHGTLFDNLPHMRISHH